MHFALNFWCLATLFFGVFCFVLSLCWQCPVYCIVTGGSKPNLADLAVFGVLRPIRHLDTGRDMLAFTKIGEWYARMEDAVGATARIQEEPLMGTIDNSMKVWNTLFQSYYGRISISGSAHILYYQQAHLVMQSRRFFNLLARRWVLFLGYRVGSAQSGLQVLLALSRGLVLACDFA